MAEVIGAKTLKIKSSRSLAQEIAAFLLVEHRTREIDSLLRDVIQYRAEHGVVEAVAISAQALSKTVKKDIKAFLHDEFPVAKTLAWHDKRDPGVVGGLKIELPNEQLDITTRGKLDTFKRLTGAGREL
jgi:F0F1-type ATP synthase delta subunit